MSSKSNQDVISGGRNGDRVLRYQDLARQKGISFTRQHLSRLEDVGSFPRRFSLSGGARVVWSENEIDAWIEARKKTREAA